MMYVSGTFLVLLLTAGVSGQSCNSGTDVFGENSPNSQSNAHDALTNTGFIVLGTSSNAEIDCCGVVESWEAFIEVTGSVDLYFQIWRPVSGTYELIGENMFVADTDGEILFTVAPGSYISIQPGDRYGWYAATNVIKHKTNSGPVNTWKTFATKPAVGTTEAWTSAVTVDSGRRFALRVDTNGGSSPAFSSPADGASFTITNDVVPGTLVTTVAYADADIGDTLISTSTLQAGTVFAYNATSGEVTVSGTSLAPTTETLTFDVTDACGNTDQLTFTITITNEAPVIQNLPQSVEISEDITAETLLYTVNATDSADGFTCAFTAAVNNAWPFVIRQIPATSNYGIYVESNPGFDYATQNSYSLAVQCTDDHGAASTEGIFTVYLLKNQAPVVHNLQASTVVSTTSVIGTTVFTVNATDAEGDQIYMSMVCDPTPCPFEIFDSGDIQLTEDISSHTTTGYDISITVQDTKNTVSPKILTIIVRDINDPVLISNLPLAASVPVSENSALSSSVFQVSVSDQNNQTMTYSMSSSPGSGLTYFSLDSTTGLLSTSSANLINYESIPATSFNLVISVSDGTATDSQPLTVEIVNVNEAPAFPQSTYSLSTTEGPANTVVGTPAFAASDPDSGDTATLTYSIDCGADTGWFYMDSSTGEVRFQADYDTDSGSVPTSVTCTVTVRDTGGLNDTATLNIFVADDNDNTPFFSPASYSDHISYYATVGTSVLTVTAIDFDTGTYGTLTYTLDQTSLLDEYFTIDNNGRITVLKSPNGNAIGYATSVSLTVTATDGGGLSASAPVTITIGDTTTTSTTTTTDRYRTFLEDSRNIAWLVAACVLLAVTAGFLVWLVYSCSGDKGWAKFVRQFCNRRKKFRPKRYKPRVRTPPTPVTPESPPKPPKVAYLSTIRLPPPPVQAQQWRTAIDAPAEPRVPTQTSGSSYEFWKHKDFTDNRLTKLL